MIHVAMLHSSAKERYTRMPKTTTRQDKKYMKGQDNKTSHDNILPYLVLDHQYLCFLYNTCPGPYPLSRLVFPGVWET
jgi:hypothetical protein